MAVITVTVSANFQPPDFSLFCNLDIVDVVVEHSVFIKG